MRRHQTGGRGSANTATMAAAVIASNDYGEGVPGTRREPAQPDLPTGLPDRMSTVPDSPHYSYKYRGVAVFLNGRVMPNNVEEYCVSGGWLRTVDGRRLEGLVEPKWRDAVVRRHVVGAADPAASAASRLEAAAAKRARKAARRIRQGIVGAFAWWLVIQSGGVVQMEGEGFAPFASKEHCQRAGQIAYDSRGDNGYSFRWVCVPDETEVGE